MPLINTFVCTVTGVSVEDLRQWCSHHLSNRFTIRSEPIMDQYRYVGTKITVSIIGNKDRFRLRDAFDIADTQFSKQFLSEDEFVEK